MADLILTITADTTDEQIDEAMIFADMRYYARHERDSLAAIESEEEGSSLYREGDVFALWSPVFGTGLVNAYSPGVGDSLRVEAMSAEDAITAGTTDEQIDLEVEFLHNTYVVRDPADNSRWWPNEEAADEIASSEDPEATALTMCRENPMRGDWVQ